MRACSACMPCIYLPSILPLMPRPPSIPQLPQAAQHAVALNSFALPGEVPPALAFDPRVEPPSATAARMAAEYALNVHPVGKGVAWGMGVGVEGGRVGMRVRPQLASSGWGVFARVAALKRPSCGWVGGWVGVRGKPGELGVSPPSHLHPIRCPTHTATPSGLSSRLVRNRSRNRNMSRRNTEFTVHIQPHVCALRRPALHSYMVLRGTAEERPEHMHHMHHSHQPVLLAVLPSVPSAQLRPRRPPPCLYLVPCWPPCPRRTVPPPPAATRFWPPAWRLLRAARRPRGLAPPPASWVSGAGCG